MSNTERKVVNIEEKSADPIAELREIEAKITEKEQQDISNELERVTEEMHPVEEFFKETKYTGKALVAVGVVSFLVGLAIR